MGDSLICDLSPIQSKGITEVRKTSVIPLSVCTFRAFLLESAGVLW